jgi:hypothetical protein
LGISLVPRIYYGDGTSGSMACVLGVPTDNLPRLEWYVGSRDYGGAAASQDVYSVCDLYPPTIHPKTLGCLR